MAACGADAAPISNAAKPAQRRPAWHPRAVRTLSTAAVSPAPRIAGASLGLRGYGMRAVLVIAVAAAGRRGARAGRHLSGRCHAVDAAASEYRGELRGQTGLTT
jgi:hypothetical protein